ncbi:MAG TPA: hypothetical protein VIU64_00380 [Polyangia bacterium]
MSCSDPRTAPPPLRVTRGASKTLLFAVRADAVGDLVAFVPGVDPPLSGTPVDLTGAKVWFTVKNRVEDAGAVVTKRNAAAGGVDNQVLVTTPQAGTTLGQFKVFLDPADTAPVDPAAELWCDTWVQLPGGPPLRRYQVRRDGQLVVDPAVTTVF